MSNIKQKELKMIKSIETNYNGYKFRSRLEAKWAVFFDALNIVYHYEPQGFDLGGELGYYLPDFYLPELNLWVEIKPFAFNQDSDEWQKLEILVDYQKIDGTILDDIPHHDYVSGWDICISSEEGVQWKSDYIWCWCDNCQRIDFQNLTKECRFCGEYYNNEPSEIIIHAYEIARQARFEHGATLDPNRVKGMAYDLKRNYIEEPCELFIPVKKRELNDMTLGKIEWLKEAQSGECYLSGRVKYNDPSKVYFSVISNLIRYGYDYEEIRELLENGYGDNDYFEYIYKEVKNWIATNPLVKELHKSWHIEHELKSVNLVYKALLSLSYQFLKKEIKTSNAELRRMTGIKHYETITRTLDILENKSLIYRNEWKISILNNANIKNTNPPFNILSSHNTNDIEEALNLEYILAKNALKILQLLINHDNLLFKEIYQFMNITRQSIAYHLNKLQNLGIITYEKTGRTKTYHLTENHEMILYELMADHMNENHLKIAASQARYHEFLKESELYEELKKEHGPEKALAKIKEIRYNIQNAHKENDN